MGWNFGDILDAVGGAVPPDAPAFIHGERIIPWGEANRITNNLARAMIAHRANQERLEKSLAMSGAHAAHDQAPPDEDRSAVTMYALSRATRLPYETVRRHATILVEEALCIRTAAGLIVPASVVQAPHIAAGSAQVWALAADFIAAAFGPAPTRGAP